MWKDLSDYLKKVGVKGKRIYNLRDKYCDKIEITDVNYEKNVPFGCKPGESYLILKC
jgi:hypothetical protein